MPIDRSRDVMRLGHRGNPKGKNPGDYWNIPTSPFPGAHFAVYPEAICTQPILSSCPAQICVECGTPTTRITEVTYHNPRSAEKDHAEPRSQLRKRYTPLQKGRPRPQDMPLGRAYAHRKTVGWSDCGCSSGFKPGTVLDPMAGAGTTLLVAQKLRRRFIGIELNPKYCQIIIDRWQTYTDMKAVLVN